MSFTDPQSVTVNSIAISLPRVTNPTGMSGYFSTADGTTALGLKIQKNSRDRYEARLDYAKIAADPITAVNQKWTGSVSIVINNPPNGVFTDTEIKNQILGLTGWATSANLLKLLGDEA
jgi:hypothetical protein